MPDKRGSPRKKRRFLIEFDSLDSSGTGFTYDISPTGMFVRSVRIPRPGTFVTATLTLPGGKKILLEGRVVRAFRAPAILSHLVPSGFSLRLSDCPEDLSRYLSTL